MKRPGANTVSAPPRRKGQVTFQRSIPSKVQTVSGPTFPKRTVTRHGWAIYDPAQGKLLPVEGLPEKPNIFPLLSSLYRIGTHYYLFAFTGPGRNDLFL